MLCRDRHIKLFKYLGLLDASGRPQSSYREFVDHTKTRPVLAARLIAAYDDLYASNKLAHQKSADELKGWFKTKTGKGDASTKKMATTFKALSEYADFESKVGDKKKHPEAETQSKNTVQVPETEKARNGLIHSVIKNCA